MCPFPALIARFFIFTAAAGPAFFVCENSRSGFSLLFQIVSSQPILICDRITH